jgi:hypothetical protein
MAVLNTNFTNLTTYPNSFSRQEPTPLEAHSLFTSKKDAENYAKNDPVAYVGQIVVVIDSTNKVCTPYVISDTTGTLGEIGGKVDLSSYVKKSSFSSSVVGYLPKIKDADTIEPGYAINSGTTWGGTDSTVATTLAIDNRIKSYYWADVKISATSNTETSPTVKNLSATTVKIGNVATWQYNSSTDCVEFVW